MIDLKKLRERAYAGDIASGDVLELLDMLKAAQSDAARYQWLRHGGISRLPHSDFGNGIVYDERDALDAYIDAAMRS